MSYAAHLPAKHSLPARPRGAWHWCVALLTALSFLLVVSTSATHMHASKATVQDCVLCTVMADQLAEVPPPPLLVDHPAALAYPVAPAARVRAIHTLAQLTLPPICGPPQSFV